MKENLSDDEVMKMDVAKHEKKEHGSRIEIEETISLASICDELGKLKSRVSLLASAVATCPPDDGVLADAEGLYFTLESIWSDLKSLEDKVSHKNNEGRVVN